LISKVSLFDQASVVHSTFYFSAVVHMLRIQYNQSSLTILGDGPIASYYYQHTILVVNDIDTRDL